MKNVVRSKNSERSSTFFGDRSVLSERISSFFKSSLIINRESTIGTLVQSASTSNDTIISSSSIVWARINSENSLEFSECCLLSRV